MTKKQISDYIWRWQKSLRLTEWDTRFEQVKRERLAEEDEEDKVAEISMKQGSMTATLNLATKRPDDEIAGSIRHELLHLTLFDIMDFVTGLVAGLGAEASARAEGQAEDIEERTVLRLARMVDELLIEQNK